MTDQIYEIMKYRLPLILLFYLIASNVSSQNITNSDIAKQVDEQLWQPFSESYAQGDFETFNSLHTENVKRIGSRGILVGEAYRASNERAFRRENRMPKTIEFVFEHRIYSSEIGYEIGYYKMSFPENPERDPYYARFTVLLEKVDGIWKIAQDWDTDSINGQKVSAQDYEKLEAN